MKSIENDILSEVSDYYTEKLLAHGDTPQGVDWNGADSQELRFSQLCKIITSGNHFTLNDIGCGYGALYDALSRNHQDFHYTGIDISHKMIEAAAKRHNSVQNAKFHTGSKAPQIADYSIASGIFNVKQLRPNTTWRDYVLKTLDSINNASRVGFSFNCLTSYSDKDKMRDNLYYADPCEIFDICKRRYSNNVALLHDYGLYEFTILVRKTV